MKDVKINFTNQDKALLDILIKVVARGKYTYDGAEETIVASDAMRWLSRLKKQIETEASKPDMEIKSIDALKAPEKVKKGKS